MGYCIAALLVIFAANFVAEWIGSQLAKQLTLIVTAGSPFIFAVGLTVQQVRRSGAAATFHDPYFNVVLPLIGVAVLATTATALLGRAVRSRAREPVPFELTETRPLGLILGLCGLVVAVFVFVR
jgi:tellurite resistance protein TehA-like permease